MLVKSLSVSDDPLQREIRRVRVYDFQQLQGCKGNKVSEDDYISVIKEEIKKVVQLQEELDIDVLVHGEPEVSFPPVADCFVWVQSYGSRCVKPPIIYGLRDATRLLWSSRMRLKISRKLVIKDEVEDLEAAFTEDDSNSRSSTSVLEDMLDAVIQVQNEEQPRRNASAKFTSSQSTLIEQRTQAKAGERASRASLFDILRGRGSPIQTHHRARASMVDGDAYILCIQDSEEISEIGSKIIIATTGIWMSLFASLTTTRELS
ncbi:hypothetical protein Dimus_015578 [Dionaea muscipula]